MHRDYEFRHATPNDLVKIQGLLEANDMPSAGLDSVISHCLVAKVLIFKMPCK